MGERYRVEVLAEASADLTRIFDYIERDSPQNAASVLTSIFDAIDSLDHFPHRCKIHLSRRDPSRVIRSMVVAPFIIFTASGRRKRL